MEGHTLCLPIGTDVETDDYVEYRPPRSEPQLLIVIDVIRPYMPGAGDISDHIELTCVPCERADTTHIVAPALHPAMVTAIKLAREGRMSEAVLEALQLIETRVRSLGVADGTMKRLIAAVFGAKSSQLAIVGTTRQEAEDTSESLGQLSIGAIHELRDLQGALQAFQLHWTRHWSTWW